MAFPGLTRRGLLRTTILGAANGAISLVVSACGGQTITPTRAPTTAPAVPPTATAAAVTPTAAATAAATPTTAAASPTAAAAATPTARAAAATGTIYPSSIRIGINLPFTGADATGARNIRDGALLAVDEINARGGIAGRIKIEPLIKDDGTVTAGEYDPAQARTNMKQFVADSSVLAVVGPQMSGSGKTMSPIASNASLPIITPSSTSPDITDPNFASVYRPKGKAIYFRTVTTDAFAGPFMANYAADVLKLASICVLDDTGPYGERIAGSFEAQAKAKGINVLGHDKLDPKESDYTTILTRIKGLNPDGLYYGGVQQMGVKLAKQAFDVLPKLPKLGGDGMFATSFPKDAGPAAEGWYATIVGPDVIDQPEAKDWVAKYKQKYNKDPLDYAVTAYDAVLVASDTIERVVKDGKPLTRDNVESYMLQTNLKTLQGTISFDENGDIVDKVVSIFQVVNGDYKFVGAAPQS